MTDQTISCRDCKTEFVFTAGERDQFASQGRHHAPSRCATCREARQRVRADRPNNGTSFGVNGRRDPIRFPIVCVECGKNSHVPFQPRDLTRVYCSDCHAAQRGAAPRARAGGGTSW